MKRKLGMPRHLRKTFIPLELAAKVNQKKLLLERNRHPMSMYAMCFEDDQYWSPDPKQRPVVLLFKIPATQKIRRRELILSFQTKSIEARPNYLLLV